MKENPIFRFRAIDFLVASLTVISVLFFIATGTAGWGHGQEEWPPQGEVAENELIGSVTRTVAQRWRELKELFEAGLLTEAEFIANKKIPAEL